MCICVCNYVCIGVCIYECIRVYTYVCRCICVNGYVHMYSVWVLGYVFDV